MNDVEFLDALETGRFPPGEMTHRAHLRLALLQPDAARIAALLRSYVAAVGAADKYNQTLTHIWVRLVSAARLPGDTVDSLVARAPELLDPALPLRFYSAARLHSPEARAAVIAPDLAPLPPLNP